MRTFIITCSLCLMISCKWNSGQYTIQKEIHTEDINGNKKQFTIIKTLRKQDRLPVSIFTKSENGHNVYETMDSIYYNANGSVLNKKSFVKHNNKWVPAKTKS